MTPTDILKHEHKIVLMVLDGAEKIASAGVKASDANILRELVDFLKNFTDRCHHAKEEKNLFVKMKERGVPEEGGPIGAMLHDHDVGRKHVKALEKSIHGVEAGDASALAAAGHSIEAYAELLRSHIWKEDNILYPLADDELTAEDQRELLAEFQRIEIEEMGEGAHGKFHDFAHRISDRSSKKQGVLAF